MKNKVARMRTESKLLELEKQKEQDKIAADILQFYSMQQRKKKWDEQFNQAKKAFYSYMQDHNIEEARYGAEFHNKNVVFKVKKVQKKTIVWNVKKLYKRLRNKKDIRDQIINKKYTIIDMKGLIEYLKDCNVDPDIFKSFIEIEMNVNEKVMNNLHDLGKITKKDVSDCYNITMQNPYWLVSKEEDEK